MTNMLILFGCYAMMVLLFYSINRRRPGIASYQQPRSSDLKTLSVVHVCGMLLMLLPAWFIQSPPIFLLLFPEEISMMQVVSLLLCFLLLAFLPWKKWENKTEGTKDERLSVVPVMFYFCLRIIFLIVYEWFFRGLLLISLVQLTGTVWGIALTILLYMLAHIHKDRKEIAGCIPLGLLLCLITLWWQSIWPAILIHLQIAIINEWPPLYRFFSLQKKTIL